VVVDKGKKELWDKIWKIKYVATILEDELISMEREHHESLIWNNAWSNRGIFQAHFFWEIQNGHSTVFREDAWK
jgi:hypothetical protein